MFSATSNEPLFCCRRYYSCTRLNLSFFEPFTHIHTEGERARAKKHMWRACTHRNVDQRRWCCLRHLFSGIFSILFSNSLQNILVAVYCAHNVLNFKNTENHILAHKHDGDTDHLFILVSPTPPPSPLSACIRTRFSLLYRLQISADRCACAIICITGAVIAHSSVWSRCGFSVAVAAAGVWVHVYRSVILITVAHRHACHETTILIVNTTLIVVLIRALMLSDTTLAYIHSKHTDSHAYAFTRSISRPFRKCCCRCLSCCLCCIYAVLCIRFSLLVSLLLLFSTPFCVRRIENVQQIFLS